MEIKEYMKQLGNVRPNENQLRWFDMEMYAFIHFSPNTYTGKEWGDGTEDHDIFNPTEHDCEGWARAIKAAGLKGAIITAKHHDGFCLWQTKTTEHSIKNSPYKNGKGDIVRELSDACRKVGIKFGFYLSPWDRNSEYYGTDKYNDFFKAQLTELLTGYGEVFEVWFDEANGETATGKRQEYDFDGYFELIRKYQPNAVIYNDHSPDVRWIGNESGSRRHAEWAVVPYELCHRLQAAPQTASPVPGTMQYIFNTYGTIGDFESMIYSRKPVFAPAEVDTSIRPGWFYHPLECAHSLEHLKQVYLNSVGNNTCLNLNIPPMPNGKFDENDVARLLEFGNWIKTTFSDEKDLFPKADVKEVPTSETQKYYDITFDGVKKISYIELCEDIAYGQRISSFSLSAKNIKNVFFRFADDTTIGHKKICRIGKETDSIRIYITGSRDVPLIKSIRIFEE